TSKRFSPRTCSDLECFGPTKLSHILKWIGNLRKLRRAEALQSETVMFSDTKFWRLVWKEYRTQRPLWLVLGILTPLSQSVILGLVRCFSRPPFGTMDDN